MDAALGYSDDDAILNPLQHLNERFIADKFEELQAATPRIVNDPAYKYHDFGMELRQTGNRLLSGGNLQGGVLVLQSPAELFPESAETQFSFASAQEQLKQYQKAEEGYRKVIALDPGSALGEAAKSKLEDLRKR